MTNEKWKRKDNSSQATTRRIIDLSCVTTSCKKIHNLAQEYEPDSLSETIVCRNIQPFQMQVCYSLGSANPCPIDVHMEPFSTSVFKVLIWIFATTTKICTMVHSIRSYDLDLIMNHTSTYSFSSPSLAMKKVVYRSVASAPSIFRASSFGR